MLNTINFSNETTPYQAALYYVGLGFAVLPLHSPVADGCSCHRLDCRSVGKHPRTEFGAKDATTDIAQINEWEAQWPDANIGINVGRSNLIVIDLDPDHGGYVRDLPITAAERYTTTVRTGGRGWHLYYQAPVGLDISNSNKRCPPGIDIRAGDGAYVVAPPSRHVSGCRYRFVPGRELRSVAPRPLPASLESILTIRNYPAPDAASVPAVAAVTPKFDSSHAYVSAALTSELDRLAQAREGSRNNTLNEIAFNLGQFIGAGLLSRIEVEELLKQAALTLGLGQREIEATIRSGLEAGMTTPRSRWPDFDQ